MQKHALLVSISLFTVSVPTFATEWLIHSNNQFNGEQFQLETIYRFSDGDLLWVGDDTEQDLSPLFSSNNIHYILPNRQLEPKTRPDLNKASSIVSSQSTTQNGFTISGFDQLTATQRQCDSYRIAVLDSGIDLDHNAFSQVNFVTPYNAINDSESMSDEYGHGTHVAGIIAADHDGSVQGACSSATIMPVRFLNQSGGGTVADAIKGISWAIDQSADLINHSWSVLSYSQPLYEVLQDANNRGIIQVAAAGNSNYDTAINASYPASFSQQIPLLLSIANWDNDKLGRATTSNYGWSTVDLAAPGTMIASLAPNDQTRIDSGTSMAAPWVSSAIAMKAQISNLNNDAQLISSLLQQAQAQESLLGYVRAGKLLDATQIGSGQLPSPQPLSLIRNDETIIFNGYALDEVVQVRFHSAKPNSSPLDLSPLSQTVSTLTVSNWDLPAGWFEFMDDQDHATQIGYTPELSSPKYLTNRHSESGNTITWSGSGYVDEYVIYKKRSSGFYELTTVSGPNNQYLDSAGLASDTYKIRSRYSIEVGERTITLSSPLSDESDRSTLAWNSLEYASIPVGSNAILPILSSHTSAQFVLESDESSLVLELRGNELIIDTSAANSGTVQVMETASGDRTSWPITVSDNAQWQIDYQGQTLSLFHIDSEVESMQKLSDTSLNITGQWHNSDSTLQLVLDNPNWQFDSATSVQASNGSPVSLKTSKQTLTLTPLSDISVTEPFDVTIDIQLNSPVQPSSSSDSRCFIATSLYQNDSEKLNFYRGFRDNILLALPYGAELVSWYYEKSPTWVEWFNSKPELKGVLRGLFDLTWWLAQYPILLLLGLSLVTVRAVRRLV